MLGDRVLHIDAHLMVIDKPSGLAVHPGPATPRSLEDHLDALRFGFQRRPQPAHRLDRDTSGCLVLGRHPKAVKRLGALFEAGEVGKLYWAVLGSAPAADEGVVVDPKGKPARTEWRVLARRDGKALVEFRPRTGRTHQIRVHAAHLGHPIVGDPVYGRGAGLLLHAREVSIPYREGADPIVATAPMPPAMQAYGFAV
jgi:tRNA pseudouridine32 synthase/23S rRNA pseudouridine746 synthase